MKLLIFFIITTFQKYIDVKSECALKGCQCNWMSREVDCSNAGISSETSLDAIPNNVTTLILDNNYFPKLNLSIFAKFANLSNLYIRGCHISSLEEMWDDTGLPAVTLLDLTHNQIRDLDSKKVLPSALKYLYLRDNALSSISSSAFNALLTGTIQHLDLSQNELDHLPRFDGVVPSYLLSLNLSSNLLGDFLDNISLSENMFQRLKHVRVLDLSSNNVSELHNFLLADMTNLAELYLAHNLIKDLDQISLKSDEHKIQTFNHWGQDSPIFWFPHGLFSLSHIDLSYNHIENLDVKIFSIDNLPSLRSINLSFNNFTCNAETYMFFEAYLSVLHRTSRCHQNHSEQCVTFPRNSFPRNFQIANINSRDKTAGYFCLRPINVKGVHVLDFECKGTCREDYIKALPRYHNWQQEAEILHTEPSIGSGFSIAIALAVVTVVCLTALVLCYKLDLWRRITGQMRYVQVRRNLLQLEGGDDAVM